MNKKRALIIFGGILLTAAVVAGLVFMRVQKGLAPAPETAPSLITGSDGTPELTEEVAISGLSHVWDVGFLPDQTMLFVERMGTISKVSGGKKQVIFTVPNLYVRGEGGLLGMTIDPDFANNPYVYACYDTPQDIRVSRWRVNADATALTDQTNIVTGMPVNTTVFPGRHSGCRPRFGADGFL